MNILVLDVGSSGMRGTLFNESGEALAFEARSYGPRFLDNGWVEQAPEDWEDAMYAILSALASTAAERGWGIDALALTSQRSSVICADAAMAPIGPAIMWQDRRTEAVCAALEGENDTVFSRSGARLNSVYSGPKMAWVRQNRPELYAQTAKFLTVPELLLYRLTGEAYLDHSYGGRSHLMNLRERRWDSVLLDLFGVEREKLNGLVPPGAVVGRLTRSAAARTGCPEGIPVITAGGDQQCGAVGQGVVCEGAVSITVGTGGFLLAAAERVPEARGADVIITPASIAGQYVLEYNLLTCCAAFDWFRREFYPGDGDFERIEAELRRSPAGAKGCLCLPYFQGRATPDYNGSARGLFANLDLGARRCDLLRALVEGLCCELGNGLEAMGRYVEVGRVQVNGGLSNSPVFREILAAVCSRPLLCGGAEDATAFGAFLVSAATLGLYPDVPAAYAACGGSDGLRLCEPDPAAAALYARQRGRMNALYREIAP